MHGAAATMAFHRPLMAGANGSQGRIRHGTMDVRASWKRCASAPDTRRNPSCPPSKQRPEFWAVSRRRRRGIKVFRRSTSRHRNHPPPRLRARIPWGRHCRRQVRPRRQNPLRGPCPTPVRYRIRSQSPTPCRVRIRCPIPIRPRFLFPRRDKGQGGLPRHVSVPVPGPVLHDAHWPTARHEWIHMSGRDRLVPVGGPGFNSGPRSGLPGHTGTGRPLKT
ncbi:hypothetical protein E9229_002640 [Paeniglutamicibacter cryotolerans]|uniref:Uncharacterized protein n=1 Tax=Paeniglutamicibacter cryotolerans TaxID=670079 RepID=A0A839QJS2_9MICC|nr:hypothetical protein [Paeniglutamicibacter cryotolerans]